MGRAVFGAMALLDGLQNAQPIEQLRQEGAAPEVVAWCERMETPDAKETCRARAGLCELANVQQKSHHGPTQLLVRGLDKVTWVVLLSVIAWNLSQHAAYLLQ